MLFCKDIWITICSEVEAANLFFISDEKNFYLFSNSSKLFIQIFTRKFRKLMCLGSTFIWSSSSSWRVDENLHVLFNECFPNNLKLLYMLVRAMRKKMIFNSSTSPFVITSKGAILNPTNILMHSHLLYIVETINLTYIKQYIPLTLCHLAN